MILFAAGLLLGLVFGVYALSLVVVRRDHAMYLAGRQAAEAEQRVGKEIAFKQGVVSARAVGGGRPSDILDPEMRVN